MDKNDLHSDRVNPCLIEMFTKATPVFGNKINFSDAVSNYDGDIFELFKATCEKTHDNVSRIAVPWSLMYIPEEEYEEILDRYTQNLPYAYEWPYKSQIVYSDKEVECMMQKIADMKARGDAADNFELSDLEQKVERNEENKRREQKWEEYFTKRTSIVFGIPYTEILRRAESARRKDKRRTFWYNVGYIPVRIFKALFSSFTYEMLFNAKDHPFYPSFGAYCKSLLHKKESFKTTIDFVYEAVSGMEELPSVITKEPLETLAMEYGCRFRSRDSEFVRFNVGNIAPSTFKEDWNKIKEFCETVDIYNISYDTLLDYFTKYAKKNGMRCHEEGVCDSIMSLKKMQDLLSENATR